DRNSAQELPIGVWRAGVLHSCPMRALRLHLARLAGGLLAIHLSLFAVIPTVLCADLRSSAAGLECTCAHGDGQSCPLHHHSAAGQKNSCSCQSATDPRNEVLATMFGPMAVLPSTILIEHSMTCASVIGPFSRPLDTSSIPDSPPPRG